MNLKNYLGQNHPRLFNAMLRMRSLASVPVRPSLIRRYLASTDSPKLQLGAGRNPLPGWLNTDYWAKYPDFIYVDVCRRFPLPDGVFTRIFSEHMIEHIPFEGAVHMLAECFRVMKPGGRIRIETPDLEKICGLYAQPPAPGSEEYIRWHFAEFGCKRYPPTACFAINNAMRNWDHIFVFDAQMLQLLLEEAGFRNVTRHTWNETGDPAFTNISQRGSLSWNAFETLVMEAEKP